MSVPALSTQANGISQVTADNYNTYIQTANIVTDLRSFIGLTGMKVHMTGYVTPNDGGQGFFYWNATGTGPDNGGVTNIVPTGATIGCWTRILTTGVGNGTVTSVSVVSANGVSASIANSTTTPAITISLGAITPTSVTATGSVTGSNLTGTNTGDQTITLTGDVTGSGSGSFAATIANNAVTNAKFRQSAALSVVGNATNATANVLDISGTANQILAVNAAGTVLGFQSTMDNVVIGGTTPVAGNFTKIVTSFLNQTTANLTGINTTVTNNSTNTFGQQITATGNGSSVINVFGQQVTANADSGTAVIGVTASNIVPRISSGSVNSFVGCKVTPDIASSSTITNLYNFLATGPGAPSSLTMTGSYGFYASNQGAAGITTSYGVYVAAQSGSTTNWDLFCTDGFYVKSTGDVSVGNAGLATNATAGFFWIPSCAGAASGTPANIPYSNAAAMIYDRTDFKLYINVGGTWKSVTLT